VPLCNRHGHVKCLGLIACCSCCSRAWNGIWGKVDATCPANGKANDPLFGKHTNVVGSVYMAWHLCVRAACWSRA
jgi:hypothetical protein